MHQLQVSWLIPISVFFSIRDLQILIFADSLLTEKTEKKVKIKM